MRFRCRPSLAAAAAFAFSLAAASAHAQGTPPDVVHLKDGGIARGTIVELVPNGAVTIQLVTGEMRKFSVADTTYAGPSARDPAAAPAAPPPPSPPVLPPATPSDAVASGSERAGPEATAHPPRAHIQLVGSEPGLTFYRETSSTEWDSVHHGSAHGFELLCQAACEAEVPAGLQSFALSRGGGKLFVRAKNSR